MPEQSENELTLNNLKEIDELIFRQKFSEAESKINDNLNSRNLNEDSSLIFYQKLLDILLIQKKEISVEKLEKISFLYEKKNDLNKALKYLIESEVFDGHFDKLEKIFDLSLTLGELESARIYGSKYISKLIDKKNINRAQNFLNTALEKGFFEKEKDFLFFQIALLSGDHSYFEKRFSNISNNFFGGELKEEILLYERICEGTLDDNFKKNTAFLELKAYHRFNNLSNKNQKREFLNSALDVLVHNPRSSIIYFLLIKYAVENNCKKLFLSIFQLIKRNQENFPNIEKIIELLDLHQREMSSLEDEEDLSGIDLASDLFSADAVVDQDFQRIKKIEKDISFLKGQGIREVDQDLIDELERLDENHPLLKEIGEAKDDGSRVFGKKISIKDVEEDFNREISRHLSSDLFLNKDVRWNCEIALAKTIRYLDQKTLRENYSDLVASFIMMDLSHISLEIIERLIHDKKLKEIEKINLKYLMICALMKAEQYYQALDVIEDCFKELPLLDDEIICFLYLKGENLRLLGKVREAILAYLLVKKRSPHYRMVELRLKSFE